NGIAIGMHVYEPDKVSAALMKRFWDSVKIGTSPSGTPAPKVNKEAEKAPEPKTAVEWQEVKIPEINATIQFPGKTQRHEKGGVFGYALANESPDNVSIGIAIAPTWLKGAASMTPNARYEKLVEGAKISGAKPETIKQIEVSGRVGLTADEV